MPIPERKSEEKAQDFMGRCMTADVMSKEYPDQKRRVAVCTQQSRSSGPKSNLPAMVQEELVYAAYREEGNK